MDAAIFSPFPGRSLVALFHEFERELRDLRGCTPRYVRETLRYLQRLAILAGMRILGDFTVERIRSGLAAFCPGRRAQRYARAAAQDFARWLVTGGLLERDPLTKIGRPRLLLVRPRRALTLDEFQAILAAVPSRFADRRLVYLLAVATGLRARELRELRRGDVHLDTLTIRVRRETTKSRVECFFPLFAEVAAAIAPLCEGDPQATLFRSVPRACTLREDCRRARVEVKTADGLIDFHALRHTFASAVAVDLPLPIVRDLARHADMRTTANYVHTLSGKLRSALADARTLRRYVI